MINIKAVFWIITCLLSLNTGPLFAQFVKEKTFAKGSDINPNLHHATNKKLIQTSNNLLWSFVKDNISMMEARHPQLGGVATGINGPFDKNLLMLRGDKLWTEDDVQLNLVSQIKWGRYTDNFVILYFGDSLDFDFFNDRKWSIIISNAAMVSKMVKAGRFKGVFFDNENYFEPSHAWQYDSSWYPGHTFEAVKAKCRERGNAFMKALQSRVPEPLTILDFFWFGDFWNEYDKNTSREILWLPFMDGVLDAARPQDILIDGNEGAYWYQETSMFTDIYNEFRVNRFPKYGAKDLQEKFKTQVQIGHGIYPNLYYDKFERWPFKQSAEEQDTWWRHQLYNSLLTADKYVWIWSEKWDWWGNGGMALTPNFTSIISEVKAKINNQESLNFDLINHSDNWKINLVKPTEKWHVATSPTVLITSPANRSKPKSTITIKTKASGNTSKVEFYANSIRVGVDNVAPYSIKVRGLAKGTYNIFARAIDSKNEHTTSAPVVVTVGKK